MNPYIFILLLNIFVYSSANECDDVTYVDTCTGEPDMLCEKHVMKDGKPICNGNFVLQMKQGSGSFEYLTQAECKDGIMSGIKKKGGLKVFDIDTLRCAKEVCRINPSMGNGKCLPEGVCKAATRDNDKIKCDAGYHLEVQNGVRKAWTAAVPGECRGDEWRGNPFMKREHGGVGPWTETMSFRCRKDLPTPTACEITPYFNENDVCDKSIKCTKPDLKNDKVECPPGATLQAVFDDWNDVNDLIVECGNLLTKPIIMKPLLPAVDDHVEYEPQLLRCRQDALCSKTLSELEASCDDNKCTPIDFSPNNMAIVCPPQHYIEGQVNDNEAYNYVGAVQCFSDTIYSLKEDLITVDANDYKKLRCHKPRTCDMNNLYKDSLCEDEVICEKPVGTTDPKCNNGYKLQYYDVTASTIDWKDAQKVECKTDHFKVVDNLIISDIVPLGFRCMKEKKCEIANYGAYNNNCDPTKDECEQPVPNGDKLECLSDYQLQATDPADAWKEATSIKCISNTVFKSTIDGSVTVLKSARCVRKKIDFDVATDCETDPKQECNRAAGYSPMKCEEDYQLQLKEAGGGQWTDVLTEIKANSDKFTVGGIALANHPDGIRCVRMNTGSLFVGGGNCKDEEECEQATGYKSMTCKAEFKLQVKIVEEWKEVKSIAANSAKYTVLDKEGNPLGGILSGIRCMRQRCSICALPTCESCTHQSTAGEWNKCATFGCGPNSRTIVGAATYTEDEMTCYTLNTNQESFWSNKTAGSKFEIKEEVKCEKLCSLMNPSVKSDCMGDDSLCEPISFNDDNVISCEGELVRKSKPDQKGTKLMCDKTKGEWKLTTKEGEITVDTTDNVYCVYEDCKIVNLCPNCEKDDKKYRCPKGNTARIKHASSEDTTDHKSITFSCNKGKWVDNEMNNMEERTVECLTQKQLNPEPLSGGSHAVVYVIVLLIILILLVLLIACVVCKAKGNGWLHMIILEKIRGGDKKDKKGKKDAKGNKKGSSKGGSNKGDSSMASGKPGDLEGQSSAEGIVRPSGEKVSAEGISQTGVSAETVGTQGGEGGGVEGGNPTPVDSMANYPPPPIYPPPVPQQVFYA